MILFAIAGAALLLGDFPGKWLAIVACGGAVLVGGLVITSPNRLSRIMATYQTCSASDMQGVCYQAVHGKYAMASGGLLGVGIGNSGEKWGYLPEAHNDFIFAIIGEETGFVGASLVILLFLVLGWCMLVVALQSQDRYITLVLASITVWIVGQAFVNIGVVVGLFPVMGVPLPFVSAGGFVVDSVFGRCRRNHQHDETAAADPSGDAAGLSVGCDRSIRYRVLRCANVDEM